MMVHVVIREDQNEHGFVDTSIEALFRTRSAANVFIEDCVEEARQEGLRVSGGPGTGDWDVYWKVEAYSLD